MTGTDPFEQMSDMAHSDASIDPGVAAALRRRVERALAGDRTSDRPGDSAARTFDLAGTARATARATARTTASGDATDRRDPATADATTTGRNNTMTQAITPYLCVHDATAALEWYTEFFGASVSNVIPWEGRVGHSEVDISGAVFYLSDEAHALGVYAPERDGSRSAVSIVLQVAVVEEFVARAERGGAVVQRPIEEAHGSRNAWLVDPFGHRWNVGTPVYDEQAMAARRGPSEPYYMTIRTGDVERAAAFYGAVLGWSFSAPNPNGGRHVENTDMPIGIRPTDDQFGSGDAGDIEMWFTARDFDDAVERVRTAGGTVVELNAWDSGREAICDDDQGVRFKLSEPAPGYDR